MIKSSPSSFIGFKSSSSNIIFDVGLGDSDFDISGKVSIDFLFDFLEYGHSFQAGNYSCVIFGLVGSAFSVFSEFY